MSEFLSGAYPWFKVMHILSFISWMAALLYLPRLFVYHAEKARPGSELSETYKIMERRLHRGIMNPAMMSTWIFGLLLAVTPGIIDWQSGYFHVKLAAVVAMTGMHVFFGRQRRAFAEDRNTIKGRSYRFLNEVPALLMVVIVIMIVVRPF